MERKINKIYLEYVIEVARRSTLLFYRSMLSKNVECDIVPPFPPVVMLGIIKARFPISVVYEFPSGQILIVVPISVHRNRNRVIITYKVYEVRDGVVFEDDVEVESEFATREYAELFARRLRKYARMFGTSYAS